MRGVQLDTRRIMQLLFPNRSSIEFQSKVIMSSRVTSFVGCSGCSECVVLPLRRILLGDYIKEGLDSRITPHVVDDS